MADDQIERLANHVAELEGAIEQLRKEVAAIRTAIWGAPAAAAAPAVAAASAPAAVAPSAPAASPRRIKLDERTVVTRGLLIIGVLLLLFGIGYALELVFEHDWIGPAGRIALGLVAGAALIVGATRIRARRFIYLAEGLIGLGGGVLYLSLWAAASFYHFISPAVGTVAMLAITATLCVLAFTRNSERIALFGLIGGFLTPFILSTGAPIDRITLAAYVLVLSGGLLGLAVISRFRFVEIAVFIGAVAYAPDFAIDGGANPWSWQQSLSVASLFFMLYAGALVWGVRRDKDVSPPRLVATIVSVLAYMLALQIDLESNRTIHALALLALAGVLLAGASSKTVPATLQQTYGWLGIAAVTLAVPAFFEGASVARLFAVEAALLALLANRTRQVGIGVASAVLFLVSFSAMTATNDHPEKIAFANGRFFTFAIYVAAFGYALHLYRSVEKARAVRALGWVFVNVVALYAISIETITALQPLYSPLQDDVGEPAQVALSLTWTAYAAVAFFAGLRFGAFWRRLGVALFAITVLKMVSVDFAFVELTYRVFSMVALGLVLVAASALYQRGVVRPR